MLQYTKFYITFFLFIIFSSVYAQTPSLPPVIPPSPDIAALSRYAEIPVGYSTGVPDISIPIYTIKTGKLTLPISISYHASGIKVRDMASIIGLGWALNAGGNIGRTVLGRRDESNDYIAPYKTTDDLITARNSVVSDNDITDLIYYYQNMSKLNFETQSDRYAYNFNGKSGIFRYDWITGGVHLIPYAPLKITKQYLNNNASPLNLYYQIVDEEGTQYSFQAAETTSQNGLSPVTAWNLTKIVSTDQKDEINLYYTSGTETIVQASEVCTMVKSPGNLNGAPYDVPPISSFTRTPIGTQQFPQRLDSIVTKDAIVRFLYAADRQDGRQMRLTNISVYNKSTNTVLRQASFIQSYFGTASAHNARLRLDNVNLGGSQTPTIENYTFGYNNAVGPGYYMTNGYVFPGGTSFPAYIAEDYWGYNGQGNGGIPSEFLGFLNSSELATYGGNKNPDPVQAQQGILQQIQYPTGGKSVFEFESNKTDDPNFYHYLNQTNANNNVIGGLRIKTIKNYNSDNSLSNQKSYTYDLIGAQQEISAVLFNYQQQVHYFRTNMNQGVYAGIDDLRIIPSNIATSSSVYPLSVMGSSPVIYAKVTEYNGTITYNSGKTEYVYNVPLETTLESTNILSSPKFINEFTIDRGTPNPLLQSKTIYKNVNGTYSKVSEIDNTYTTVKTDDFFTGIRVDQEVVFNDLGGHFSPDDYSTPYLFDYLNSYTWEATKGHEDVALLTGVTTTDYSDINNPVSKVATYQYANLSHLQPTQKTETSSTGDNLITQYKYPSDFVSTSPYDNMYNTLHIWTPVVEQLDSKYNPVSNTTSFLQSTKTDYQIWNNNSLQVYPATVSTKTGAGNYSPRIQYTGYDTQGNIIGVSKAGGPSVSYQWGYNKIYPVAQVTNAGNTEFYYEGFEESTATGVTTGTSHTGKKYSTTAAVSWTRPNSRNYVISYWYKNSSGVWLYQPAIAYTANTYTMQTASGYDDIRICPADAQMTTYTYEPLIGVTSTTDAKGETTYYEYDNFQRLINIKDKDGYIVKHMDYHYQGQ